MLHTQHAKIQQKPVGKRFKYFTLLQIMCGYQCDKAVNENDTREVMFHSVK